MFCLSVAVFLRASEIQRMSNPIQDIATKNSETSAGTIGIIRPTASTTLAGQRPRFLIEKIFAL
jgi:hypothetical protein